MKLISVTKKGNYIVEICKEDVDEFLTPISNSWEKIIGLEFKARLIEKNKIKLQNATTELGRLFKNYETVIQTLVDCGLCLNQILTPNTRKLKNEFKNKTS